MIIVSRRSIRYESRLDLRPLDSKPPDRCILKANERIASCLFISTMFAGAKFRSPPADTARDEREAPEVRVVSFVLDDVQKTWDRTLPAQKRIPYRHAKLVLYRNSFPSACGRASMSTGPFYCPGDEKVYLDLGFFNELKRRFGAPGEFAQAYVIAHEIGHHVQKLLGIETKVRRLQQREPGEANPLSVRLELQAIASRESGPIRRSSGRSSIKAISALRCEPRPRFGDDRLQRMGQGYVNPESFTHGTSAQRVQWFRRGLETGRISACDTFK